MRIQGRLLRPENLAERRVLKSLGVDYVRVARRLNPYAVARLIRYVSFGGADMPKLRRMLAPRATPVPAPPPPPPVALPDSSSAPAEHAA